MQDKQKQQNKRKKKKKQFMDFLDVLVGKNNRRFKENTTKA